MWAQNPAQNPAQGFSLTVYRYSGKYMPTPTPHARTPVPYATERNATFGSVTLLPSYGRAQPLPSAATTVVLRLCQWLLTSQRHAPLIHPHHATERATEWVSMVLRSLVFPASQTLEPPIRLDTTTLFFFGAQVCGTKPLMGQVWAQLRPRHWLFL